jgi:hypothetical protein
MVDDRDYLRLLRRKAEQIAARSPGLESMPGREAAAIDSAAAAGAPQEPATLEAVVRWYRPVLAVTDDRFVISQNNPGGDPRFIDPNQAASKALMDAWRPVAACSIRSSAPSAGSS